MEDNNLKNEFEWCRKGLYNVQIELGCYELKDGMQLKEGFEEKEFEKDGVLTKYAVKSGFNVLEQNHWTASPNKPFIITGTVGERWPVKLSNLNAYDVDPIHIGIEPITVSTKDPSQQEFMIAYKIQEGNSAIVVPSWAFANDGSIDNTQIMQANSKDSLVPHNGGDYIVAKHIEGQPEYFELPEQIRNSVDAAKLYDPRIVNGSIMATTYDTAITKEEITSKYASKVK